MTGAAVVQFTTHLQEPPQDGGSWGNQSLAQGAAGIALLHLEWAAAGHCTWTVADRWIRAAAAGEISAADVTGLYLGAPALAFVLSATPPASTAYSGARHRLHGHVTDLAHRRAVAGAARIAGGRRPAFAEYDVFYGLTGIGAYLLRTEPHGSAMQRVLHYLVALTHPVPGPDGRQLPGWWVHHDTHRAPSPHGQGNLGAAHGVTGVLLLLAQAARRGLLVDGQAAAIRRICDHLDTWRQDGPTGPWWPEHLTLTDLATGRTHQPGPGRPSWCYGTTGIARAGQLAALALGDLELQRFYEDALYRCLTDPAQLARLDNTGLCHGWAGVYQTAFRAAHDAPDPPLTDLLPSLGRALTAAAQPGSGKGPGLLEGDAGTGLVLTTLADGRAPTTGWDACLLIN